MNILVLGCGNIGFCIASVLLDKTKHSVSVYDIQQSNMDRLAFTAAHRLDEQPKNFQKFDLVISSLPYFLNIKIADQCIKERVAYMDLGGCVKNTHTIKELAERKSQSMGDGNGSFVFTDAGLAPGLVNIWAGRMIKKYRPEETESVTLYVGGIPNCRPRPYNLNYKITWSVDGLINEYKDKCAILEKGKVKYTGGLTRLEKVKVNEFNLEAFCTSGASAHSVEIFQKMGYENFSYKTLRWPGHCKLVKDLMAKYSDSHVVNVLKASSLDDERDIVLMSMILKNKEGNELQFSKEIWSKSDYTAMQLATAIPTVAIGLMYLDGDLRPIYNTYQNVIDKFKEFNNRLVELELEIL